MSQKSRMWRNIMSKVLVFSFILTILVVPGYLFSSDLIGDTSELRTSLVKELRQVISAKTNLLEDDKDDITHRVEKIINNMSPEQKAGQLMMVGFNGTVPDYYINRMIDLRHVGGIILFSRNIRTPIQVGSLINNLQAKSSDNGDLPLFIAVDQEWGEISRFKQGVTIFPGPTQLGKIGSGDMVRTAAIATAKELRAMGFNINLAPVLDVGDSSSIMANRVFGDDAAKVADLGLQAIRGLREGGVIPTAKHFPGLGSAQLDPHKGTVEIKSDLTALRERDLLPYKRAIADKVEMILVANAMYPKIDSKKPAGFSTLIQTRLLREELGYQGVVLSDDLEMGAALSYSNIGNLAVQAISSGSDIILVCHTAEKQKEAYDALVTAIKEGIIPEQQLHQSLERIITLKLQWNLDRNFKVDLSEIKDNVNQSKHREASKTMFQQLDSK